MDQPPPRRLDEEAANAAGGQLCELAAHVHAALAELAHLAASFDAAGGWGGAGIRSCVHWLSIRAGLDLSTSADLVRIGHALADLPLLRQAFAAGQLTLDKVRALIRVATPGTRSGKPARVSHLTAAGEPVHALRVRQLDEEVWLELRRVGVVSAVIQTTRRTSTAKPPSTLALEPDQNSGCSPSPRQIAKRAIGV